MLATFGRIFGSRKAVFTLIAMAATVALAWTSRITGTEALDFMKWVLTVWLGAQAAEDVARHIKGTHPGVPAVGPSTAAVPPPVESDPGFSKSDSVPPSA